VPNARGGSDGDGDFEVWETRLTPTRLPRNQSILRRGSCRGNAIPESPPRPFSGPIALPTWYCACISCLFCVEEDGIDLVPKWVAKRWIGFVARLTRIASHDMEQQHGPPQESLDCCSMLERSTPIIKIPRGAESESPWCGGWKQGDQIPGPLGAERRKTRDPTHPTLGDERWDRSRGKNTPKRKVPRVHH